MQQDGIYLINEFRDAPHEETFRCFRMSLPSHTNISKIVLNGQEVEYDGVVYEVPILPNSIKTKLVLSHNIPVGGAPVAVLQGREIVPLEGAQEFSNEEIVSHFTPQKIHLFRVTGRDQ